MLNKFIHFNKTMEEQFREEELDLLRLLRLYRRGLPNTKYLSILIKEKVKELKQPTFDSN